MDIRSIISILWTVLVTAVSLADGIEKKECCLIVRVQPEVQVHKYLTLDMLTGEKVAVGVLSERGSWMVSGLTIWEMHLDAISEYQYDLRATDRFVVKFCVKRKREAVVDEFNWEKCDYVFESKDVILTDKMWKRFKKM
jgi:hypothetical protein